MKAKRMLRFDQLSYVPSYVLGTIGVLMIAAGRWVQRVDDAHIDELPDTGDEPPK